MNSTMGQSESEASAVPVRATQGAETQGRDWSWAEATVWSERMLAALEFFAAQGLFTIAAARVLASRSR